MTRPCMWAFVDEMHKIAEAKSKDEAIYSPGIVAHEAGHARVHEPIPRDMLLQYGQLGTHLISKAIAKRSTTQRAALNALIAGGLAADAIRLGDEYASTLIGLKKLKDEENLSNKELAHEGGRLVSAGLGYAGTPAMRATFFSSDQEAAQKMRKVIGTGQLLTTLPTFSSTGPKVSANEAERLVKAISPDTDVYASKKPVSGGSFYMPRSYTPIGKAYTYLSAMVLGMNKDDAKRLSQKGGVVVAPVAPVANIGLSVAHSVLSNALGPFPVPPITFPGADVKLVEGKARGK